ILVNVDDLVFATADSEALTHVNSELQKRHTCTDLGEVTSYLGLRITRDRAQRTITLTQSHMVQQVLHRFGFTYSSPQSTPLSTGHSLSAPPSDESVEPSGPYPELVGCLMCLMTCTRPDLAYPLSLLARYVAPGRHRKVHWDAAKRVLHYLCSTSSMGLVLGGRARVVLTGHADASWELRWLTYLLTDLGEAPSMAPAYYLHTTAAATAANANAASAAPAYCAPMASLRVLAFDHEGRPIQFDTWLDDLHLYLLSDSKDSVSLFDLASSAATAPPATADSTTRSQWLNRDAAARLAIRNHLPLAECTHFGQHRTAHALYDAVVARYSSPATAALGRLLLPYLFPELSVFATVEDLVSHLGASDARYRATIPAEGAPPPPLPPPMPLLLLQTSQVLRTSELLLRVRSAAAARARVAGVVEGAAGVVVGAAVEVVEVVEVVAMVGQEAGVGALVAAVEAAVRVAAVAAVEVVAVGLELSVEVPKVASGSSSSVEARPSHPSSFVSGCFGVGHLGVVIAARMSFAQ
ncbi:unnamed protein product, partial [Closterium sp. NIES-54]